MGLFIPSSLRSCKIWDWTTSQDEEEWKDAPRYKSLKCREDILSDRLVIFSVLFTILDYFISSFTESLYI